MENRSGDLHTKRKKNDDVQHWNGVRYAESVCCYKAYQHPSSSSDTSDTSDTSFSSASISLLPHGLFSPFFLYNFSLFFSFISRCFHSPPPSFDPCFSGRDHSPFPSRSESNDEEKMERINDNNPATSAEDEMPELIAGSYQMVQSISIIQSLGQN